MALTSAEIERLERAAATAWPAERLTPIDGWTLRESGGGSRRANSVLPLGFQGDDVEAAITAAERHYAARGLQAYFQVSEIATPGDLDARLAARGYALEEPTLLMSKELIASGVPDAVDTSARYDVVWLTIYGADLTPDRRAGAPAVLDRVPKPRAFFMARRDSIGTATALGVIVDGVAVVECVATAPTARRQGHALRVMQALEAWAFDAGARTIALQVVARNAAARTLYARLGYRQASAYHYRVRTP